MHTCVQTAQSPTCFQFSRSSPWLTLDVRVVFKWLSGEAQAVALAEATKEATKQALEVHGFAGKLGYLEAMAFAYTGDRRQHCLILLWAHEATRRRWLSL
jgi:hypothetical protein